MLAIFGLLIVTGFMVLIMTKKAPPFTSMVLVPLVICTVTGLLGQ